jgi:hypothetical protein
MREVRLGSGVSGNLERRTVAILEGFRMLQRGLHCVDEHTLVVEFHRAGLAYPRVKIKQLGIAWGEPAEMPFFDQFFSEMAAELLVIHRRVPNLLLGLLLQQHKGHFAFIFARLYVADTKDQHQQYIPCKYEGNMKIC